MSSNNGTPASIAGGESLSPSNGSRVVPRSSLYASPSRSASKTNDALDTNVNVNPPKDSALSSNATDEYISSIIDGSKVSSSNVILATSSLDGKSTTEYEILDKSLEIEDLNLGEEEDEEDDTNQGSGGAGKMKAKNIDGDVAAMLKNMSPIEDSEDEDVGEDTKKVSVESDDGVSTSSPKVNDRPSRTDTFKFNVSSFSVASIKVFSYIVSVIAIIGLMTRTFIVGHSSGLLLTNATQRYQCTGSIYQSSRGNRTWGFCASYR